MGGTDNGLGFEISGGLDAPSGSNSIESMPHKLLVFGESGSGKTMAICRGPDDRVDLSKVWSGEVEPHPDDSIFALLTESNGVAAARAVNPAVRYKLCTSLAETRQVIKAALDGSLKAATGCTRLAIDGLTEVQQQILDEMYPKGVPDELNWNGWNDRMRRFMRLLRAIPMDVYCTALSQDRTVKNARPTVSPSLKGRQIPGECMQYFDAVGFASKVTTFNSTGAAETVHIAEFSLPNRFMVKPCRSLSGSVIPVSAAWAEVLRGALNIDEVRLTLPHNRHEENTDTSEKKGTAIRAS